MVLSKESVTPELAVPSQRPGTTVAFSIWR